MSDPSYEVPTVGQMYLRLDRDPEVITDSMLVFRCPLCDDEHSLGEARQTHGPLSREYFCPVVAGGTPLAQVYRDGPGWTWTTSQDPLILLDVRP